MNGFFITMEGGDGVGKSLQAQLLYSSLTEKGCQVVLTREPGGTRISEKIREIIIDTMHTQMSPVTETLLYAAARAQLVAEVIRPALSAGKIVLCDRFLDSSIVYQGAGRGIGAQTVAKINAFAVGGLKPDLTFLFDLDPAIALSRKMATGEPDRLEKEDLSFHKEVYNAYRAVAAENPARVVVIDAAGSPDTVERAVLQTVFARLTC